LLTRTQTDGGPAKGKRGRANKTESKKGGKDVWEVQEILDSAIDADTLEHMYLVKWKGYPTADNTWEPKKNLAGAMGLVREFDTTTKKATTGMKAKVTKGKKIPGRKPKSKP
jgi:hypothetical protein